MANVKLVEIGDNVEEIREISKNTKIILEENNNISIPDVAIPTVAYWTMRCAIDYLNKHKEAGKKVSVNFLNLMELGITYREGDAEKDANFTPYVSPGKEFFAMTANDSAQESEEE